MTKQVQIKLIPLGVTVEAGQGASLESLLFRYGVEFPCGGNGECRGCRVRVLEGTVAVTPEMRSIFTPIELEQGWRLGCQARADGPLTLEIAQWETPVLTHDSALEFEPAEGLGIAVDIGTTTIAAQLLDLETGMVQAVETSLNPQIEHGSDVMTRVEYALAGGTRLTDLIRAEVLRICRALTARPVREIMLCGNSVMHHLFCGLSVEPFASVPFETNDGGMKSFRARDLGWDLAGDPEVSFLPCLGSFVGSDILAGILATGMMNSKRFQALVDLGTNGELVVGDGESMLCASTAAGPAFEAGRIRMGMRAATGAISHVSVEDGRLRCHVIGDTAARGICGSGLVDAVAAGLELGVIQPSGRMAGEFHLEGDVRLSQRDIRELQLAKAAIAAGIQMLSTRPVEQYFLAGAFGNYVSIASARRIGLLDHAEPVGNTALAGTKLVLLNRSRRVEFLEQVPARVRHVNLAADPQFQDIFTDCLSFDCLSFDPTEPD